MTSERIPDTFERIAVDEIDDVEIQDENDMWIDAKLAFWGELVDRINDVDVPDHMTLNNIAQSPVTGSGYVFDSAGASWSIADKYERKRSNRNRKDRYHSIESTLGHRLHLSVHGSETNSVGEDMEWFALLKGSWGERIEFTEATVFAYDDPVGFVLSVVQDMLDDMSEEREKSRRHAVVLYEYENELVRVTDASVDWAHGYANDPSLTIEVDGPSHYNDVFEPITEDVGANGEAIERTEGGVIKKFLVGDRARSYADADDNKRTSEARVSDVIEGETETKEGVTTWMNAYQAVTNDPVFEVSLRSTSGNTRAVIEAATVFEIVAKYINGDLGSDHTDRWVGGDRADTFRDDPDKYDRCNIGFHVEQDTMHAVFVPALEDELGPDDIRIGSFELDGDNS